MSKILETQDGSNTIHCDNFDVTYHSKYGAVEESNLVFIKEGLLCLINEGKTELHILEYGLGTGLNCLLTILQAKQLNLKIKYTGLELYPISEQTYLKLNYSAILNVDPNLMGMIHQSDWGQNIQINDNFIFCKHQIDFKKYRDPTPNDLVYYDAFGPTTQPDLWDLSMINIIKSNMTSTGLFTTYCAKGSFKRALRTAGFEVIPRPGPTGKREITTARLG